MQDHPVVRMTKSKSPWRDSTINVTALFNTELQRMVASNIYKDIDCRITSIGAVVGRGYTLSAKFSSTGFRVRNIVEVEKYDKERDHYKTGPRYIYDTWKVIVHAERVLMGNAKNKAIETYDTFIEELERRELICYGTRLGSRSTWEYIS